MRSSKLFRGMDVRESATLLCPIGAVDSERRHSADVITARITESR